MVSLLESRDFFFSCLSLYIIQNIEVEKGIDPFSATQPCINTFMLEEKEDRLMKILFFFENAPNSEIKHMSLHLRFCGLSSSDCCWEVILRSLLENIDKVNSVYFRVILVKQSPTSFFHLSLGVVFIGIPSPQISLGFCQIKKKSTLPHAYTEFYTEFIYTINDLHTFIMKNQHVACA